MNELKNEKLFKNYSLNKGSLYNPQIIDFTKEPMFLGSGRNTQRFDNPRIPFFDKSNDKQQGDDWKHDEVPLITDKTEFRTQLVKSEVFTVTVQIQKLIFLDSLQGRGPSTIFGQITTLPELENVLLTWTYFEAAKHSRTYTEILRAFYDRPDEVFDNSFKIPLLMKIAKKIRAVYDTAYYYVIDYVYKTQRGIDMSDSEISNLKKSIIMLWTEINLLEGLRFYPGFLSMWGFKESRDILSGLAENLQLICRDENSHLSLTQFVLNLLKKDPFEDFQSEYKEVQTDIEDRFYEVYFEEIEWAKFSFSEGGFFGMNENITIDYLNYLFIRRAKAVGIKPDKTRLNGKYITKNPVPWVDKFINMDKVERLPQEEQVLNYISGGVLQDFDGEHSDEILRLLKV